MDPDVPLIVPEVNPQAIAGFTKRGIIANPNCSTMQMVVALKPLHDLARIKRVVVSTYQSVSGAGREAMDELFTQTRGIYVNDPVKREHFTKQIAFNCIPHIDVFMDDGSTKEEWKMVAETRKILDPDIAVTATCVRVPVFIGHAEAINVEFNRPLSVEQARAAWKNASGITLIDHRTDEGYVTPVECAGDDPVFISRASSSPPKQSPAPSNRRARRGARTCQARVAVTIRVSMASSGVAAPMNPVTTTRAGPRAIRARAATQAAAWSAGSPPVNRPSSKRLGVTMSASGTSRSDSTAGTSAWTKIRPASPITGSHR